MEEEMDKALIDSCEIYNDEIFSILNDFNLDKETRDRSLNEVRILLQIF